MLYNKEEEKGREKKEERKLIFEFMCVRPILSALRSNLVESEFSSHTLCELQQILLCFLIPDMEIFLSEVYRE